MGTPRSSARLLASGGKEVRPRASCPLSTLSPKHNPNHMLLSEAATALGPHLSKSMLQSGQNTSRSAQALTRRSDSNLPAFETSCFLASNWLRSVLNMHEYARTEALHLGTPHLQRATMGSYSRASQRLRSVWSVSSSTASKSSPHCREDSWLTTSTRRALVTYQGFNAST